MSHQQKARSLRNDKQGQKRSMRRKVHITLDEMTRDGEYDYYWDQEEQLLRAG